MSDEPTTSSKPVVLPAETQAIGIFQSDIIIRTALIKALADLKAFPWMLDFVFASLPRDKLTSATYGEAEVSNAKEWFKRTEIPVMLGIRAFDGNPPPVAISIHLLSSEERENTLADIHHDTIEELEAVWAPLTSKFSPVSYSALTGVFKVPANILEEVTLSPFMAIVDRTGEVHPILEVNAEDELLLTIGTVADFTDCFIKPAIPPYVASLESAEFEETYGIGCHASGEPVYLTYLHSIVVFALLRYRQSLLEARGLQRVRFGSGEVKLSEVFDDMPEAMFTRGIQLTGSVRHVWPKNIDQRVLSVATAISPAQEQTDKELAFLEALDGIGTPVP